MPPTLERPLHDAEAELALIARQASDLIKALTDRGLTVQGTCGAVQWSITVSIPAGKQ